MKGDVFSKVKEAAVQRRIRYSRSTERAHANAWFLDLTALTRDDDGEDEKTAEEWDVAAQA